MIFNTVKQIYKVLHNPLGKFLCPNSSSFVSKRNYPEFRKRFYKNVTVAGTPQCYEVNLDHGKLKTPNGNILQVPSYPLALAIAHEWSSVDEKIMSCWMHLTGLSFTAIDNPQKQTLEEIGNKAIDYLATDTLLFRDESSEHLTDLQTKEWDPILEWFNERFDVDIKPSPGICVLEISTEAKEKLRKYFQSYNMWAATGILYGVEMLRSVILCTATLERKITPEKAVQLTLLESEFQVLSRLNQFLSKSKMDLLEKGVEKLGLRRGSNSSSDENVSRIIKVKPRSDIAYNDIDIKKKYGKAPINNNNVSKKINLTGTRQIKSPSPPTIPVMILPDDDTDEPHTSIMIEEETLATRILSARSSRGTGGGNEDKKRKKSNIRTLSFEDISSRSPELEEKENHRRQYLTPSPRFNRVFSVGGELDNIFSKNQLLDASKLMDPSKIVRSNSSTR